MWYAEIADLYDSLVQTDDDIPFFLERALAARGPVIELMAGTGRVAVPLLERGVALTCVDASPEMLDRLRAKIFLRGLEATVLCADLRRLHQHAWLHGSFAFGFIALSSLSELVEEEDRRAALGCARDCLILGGELVCTLHNPVVRRRAFRGVGPAAARRFPHPAGLGEVLFWLDAQLDEATGVVSGMQHFETYAPSGELLEARRVAVRFALPERAAVERIFSELDLKIESLAGDYRGAAFDEDNSPLLIWTLRKVTE
jgi:SAM-dependent methyltransferase